MSTNAIHSQMQTWLNTHGANTENYSKKLGKIDQELTEISEQMNGELTKKESAQLQEQISELEIEYLEAELEYLKGEKEAGTTFDFMEGEYDISDAETFIPAYAQQTGKLAQGDMDAWETDGEEGISLEEYKASQLPPQEESQMSDKQYEYASAYTTEVFNTIDIDGDGILEKNELQGFYAAVDNADGSVDGKINIDSLGIDFTSDKFAKNIKEFQAYL